MNESAPKPKPAASQSSPIPRFIQSQLAHPPIGPNESAAEFNALFQELSNAIQAGERSAAEYAMLLQATILTFRTVGLERIRGAMVQHMRPEAVLALIRESEGELERGSISFSRSYDQRKLYFAGRDGKAQIEAKLAEIGHSATAVELEAFQLALPSLTLIDRQINAAQKQLMAFLKEIDRRDAKRANQLHTAAVAAVVRAQPGSPEKREAN